MLVEKLKIYKWRILAQMINVKNLGYQPLTSLLRFKEKINT